MARKFTAPLFLGVFTVLAIILLTSDFNDKDIFYQTFQVDAIYYDAGYIEISFFDKSKKTEFIIMEILGMKDTFQKEILGYEFTEIVPFSAPPKYGWAVHPVILEVEHQELGHIQIKTEIHLPDTPSPPVIYSVP